MNKKITIILAVIAAISLVGIVYALTSNMLTIVPQATSLLLESSTLTPDVGTTITLTATIVGTTMNDVPVTFYANTVSIGTVNTVSGVATITYLINDYNPISIYADTP